MRASTKKHIIKTLNEWQRNTYAKTLFDEDKQSFYYTEKDFFGNYQTTPVPNKEVYGAANEIWLLLTNEEQAGFMALLLSSDNES